MTDAQIKYMVERFLFWRLPENFNPDAGISFRPNFNEHTPHPMKHEPTGTNLFDATQAEQMIRYLIEGMPKPEAAPVAETPISQEHQLALDMIDRLQDERDALQSLLRTDHNEQALCEACRKLLTLETHAAHEDECDGSMKAAPVAETPTLEWRPANNLEVRANDFVEWLSGKTFSGLNVRGEIAGKLADFVTKEFDIAQARLAAASPAGEGSQK